MRRNSIDSEPIPARTDSRSKRPLTTAMTIPSGLYWDLRRPNSKTKQWPASRIAQELLRGLRRLPPGGILYTDFTDVQMSFRFATWLIQQVFSEEQAAVANSRRIILRNLEETTRLEVHQALKELGFAMFVEHLGKARTATTWSLIGKPVDPFQMTILHQLRDQGPVIARELAGMLNIPVTTAYSRLDKLVEARLVSRKSLPFKQRDEYRFELVDRDIEIPRLV